MSSMLPENLVFDGTQHRTTRINEAFLILLRPFLRQKNKGKSTQKVDLFLKTVPRTFCGFLRALAFAVNYFMKIPEDKKWPL
ncbi:MAG: hypothetical protein JWP78_1695 [Mucilaginibacter sp.]|nr:hypothetical protein [Mucilaginibacter sp.]